MKILGINALNHDAAVAMIQDGEVLFAGHSERYSGVKNDSDLNRQLISDCFRYGKPDKVAYFERPYLKKLRQLKAGQYGEVLSRSNLPSNYLKEWIGDKPI